MSARNLFSSVDIPGSGSGGAGSTKALTVFLCGLGLFDFSTRFTNSGLFNCCSLVQGGL